MFLLELSAALGEIGLELTHVLSFFLVSLTADFRDFVRMPLMPVVNTTRRDRRWTRRVMKEA